MAADAETVPSPIDADVAAFDHVLNAAARVGAEQLALAALRVGNGTRTLVMLLAAWGASIGEVVNVLGLESGGLAAVLDVPAPKPLPDGERTTFFDDDADAPGDLSGYRGRRLLTVIDVPEPTAAQLARLVPGVRGLVLFAAARGDLSSEIAQHLGTSCAEIDAILREGDGHHHDRS